MVMIFESVPFRGVCGFVYVCRYWCGELTCDRGLCRSKRVTMRIRKRYHRNGVSTIVRVAAEDVAPVAGGPLLKSGWDGDGRSNVTTSSVMPWQGMKATTTTTTTGAGAEQVRVESVTTNSRQSASPGVSILHQGRVVEERALLTERGMKAASDVIVVRLGSSRDDDDDDVDAIVDHGAEPEGSALSMEQLWQGQDGEEHLTRHYVRRSNAGRKGSDDVSLALFESSMAAAAGQSAAKVPTTYYDFCTFESLACRCGV